MPIGFLGFLEFVLYFAILKGILQLIHIEARRTGSTTLAGVSGLFA